MDSSDGGGGCACREARGQGGDPRVAGRELVLERVVGGEAEGVEGDCGGCEGEGWAVSGFCVMSLKCLCVCV